MIRGAKNNTRNSNINMKNIKFVTTFSANGYQVYGKTWISSFLKQTENYPNITAKIYVNGMDVSQFNYEKIEIVDYDVDIPDHSAWLKLFREHSAHDQWNKDLGVKFSYKSFVMLNELKNTNDGFVIWLDADCVFLLDDFDNWPECLTDDSFILCQRERGTEHVESGIIIFNVTNKDKQKYIDIFESLYMLPTEFNNFSQFFDGFAVGRTIDRGSISYVDLNKDYGINGIQSDPGSTFLNPEIRKRFVHNIGITGKKQYADWDQYKKDPVFQLIHGVNDESPEEMKRKKLSKINNILGRLNNK